MRRRIGWLLIAACISGTGISANPGELRTGLSIISGKVIAVSDDISPLRYAFIGAYDEKGILRYAANTNEKGNFNLLLPSGWYSLVAVYDGYDKVAYDSVYLSPQSYTELKFKMNSDCTNKQYYLEDLYYWRSFRIIKKSKSPGMNTDLKFRIVDSSPKLLRLEYNTKTSQKVKAEIFNDYGELVHTFEHEVDPEKARYYEHIPELNNGNYFIRLNRQQHLSQKFTINR